MSERTIAILTPSKDNYSETFIRNHIERLPFKKVVFYGGDFPTKCEPDLQVGGKEALWNLSDIISRKRGLKVSTYHRRRFVKLLKAHKIDCVLAEFISTGAMVWEECKEAGVPLIATGLGYELSVRSVLEKRADSYRGYLSYASSSILVADHMKDVLQRFGGNRDKMIWSPSGPAEEFFGLKPNHSSKNILAIGRFVSKKAPHLTVLAFSKVLEKVSDARLKMAGDGPLLNVCKDIVKSHGIEDSVDFLGRIDQNEQKQLLRDCRIFVQHSRTAEDGDMEGTPVSLLEAMGAGVPIVSTLHAGIPNIVDDQSGLLVKEGDAQGMAEAMTSYLLDEEKARTHGLHAKERVKQEFSLKKHIDTLTQAINSACDR